MQCVLISVKHIRQRETALRQQTIVGAVAGALVGREIQRSRSTARCR